MNRTKSPPKNPPTIKRTKAPQEMIKMVEYYDKNKAQRFGEVIKVKVHKNNSNILICNAYGEQGIIPVNKIIREQYVSTGRSYVHGSYMKKLKKNKISPDCIIV